MTQDFINRIMTEGTVDTRNYRYQCSGYYEDRKTADGTLVCDVVQYIRKIPIEYVGRTGMLDPENWEMIKITNINSIVIYKA